MTRPLFVSTLILMSMFLPVNAAPSDNDHPSYSADPGSAFADWDQATHKEWMKEQRSDNAGVAPPRESFGKLGPNPSQNDWMSLLVEARIKDYKPFAQFLKDRVNKKAAALGLAYSDSDFFNTFDRLAQTDVSATPEGLENLLLVDAALKGNKSVAVASAVPSTSATGSSASNDQRQAELQAPHLRVFMDSVVGTYRSEPYQSNDHQGTIQRTADGGLMWTNQANVSWQLDPDIFRNGELLQKRAGSPYQDQKAGRAFVIVRDRNNQINGFNFMGAFYKKL